MEILGFDNKNSFRFGFCHFLKYQSCTNYVFLQLFMMLCTTQIYVFIFKTCQSKQERDLTNSLSEWKHIADTKSNNSVFHAVLKSIFQKLDFSFHTSYFHTKTAPPMNTFDLFLTQLFIGGAVFIWKYEIYNENLFFWKFSYMTLFGRISKCGDNGPA